jgi:hypothetical protein
VCTTLLQLPPRSRQAVKDAVLNNRRLCALSATVVYWWTSRGADDTARVKRDLSRLKVSRETAENSRLVCNTGWPRQKGPNLPCLEGPANLHLAPRLRLLAIPFCRLFLFLVGSGPAQASPPVLFRLSPVVLLKLRGWSGSSSCRRIRPHRSAGSALILSSCVSAVLLAH